jgi:hypothetical protein
MDTNELAWAAGFFDGEGHIRYQKGSLQLAVAQVTKDGTTPFVLLHLQKALGRGHVTGPYKGQKANHHSSYQFTISNFEYTQAAICFMWKWLGPIKKSQAKKVLTTWLTRPKPGRWPVS